jgi:Ribonuclease G/E
MVELDKECKKCHTKGYIVTFAHQNWLAKFNEKWKEVSSKLTRGGAIPTEECIYECVKKDIGNRPDEPACVPCENCHGKGYILTDEGWKLKEFLKRWL